jgi:hypothetical protein
MDSIIEKILVNAELLFERGQMRMCSRALDEIAERLKTHNLSEALSERYQNLCRRLPPEKGTILGDQEDKCWKCSGTGKYLNTGYPCFSCRSKGYQTPEDRVIEENYWARRRRMAAIPVDINKWF